MPCAPVPARRDSRCRFAGRSAVAGPGGRFPLGPSAWRAEAPGQGRHEVIARDGLPTHFPREFPSAREEPLERFPSDGEAFGQLAGEVGGHLVFDAFGIEVGGVFAGGGGERGQVRVKATGSAGRRYRSWK